MDRINEKEQKLRRKWKQRGRKEKCIKRTNGGGRQSRLLVGKTWAVILFPLWLHKHAAVCLRCWRGTSAETHQPTHGSTHSRRVRSAQTCLYADDFRQQSARSCLTFRFLRGRTSYLRSSSDEAATVWLRIQQRRPQICNPLDQICPKLVLKF